MTVWPNHLKSEQIQEGDTYFFKNIGKLSFYLKMFFKYHCCFLRLIFLSKTEEEEAWHRGCDAGSHTHGFEFESHWGIYLYVFRFISALSYRVLCPDGIKLQSLGNVRFRNWRRELGNDYRNDRL